MNKKNKAVLLAMVFVVLSIPLFSVYVLAQSGAATEQNMVDAILERKTFTSDQLTEMDLNKDNCLDVADVINLVKSSVVAEFDAASSITEEGNGSVGVKVRFSPTFAGTLRYTVSGTAAEGSDYVILNRSIQVNGDIAEIPITINDDTELEDAETVSLTLYYNESETIEYVPGSSTDHTLYIYDNDAIWNGVIKNKEAALHFQMKVIQSPAKTSASLITDGYGVIPLNVSASEFPAQSATLNSTLFDATVDQITIPANLTRMNVALKRKLVFHADSQLENNIVNPKSEIMGSVKEIVTCDTEKQLGYDTEGTFVLLRQISNIAVSQTPLEDVN